MHLIFRFLFNFCSNSLSTCSCKQPYSDFSKNRKNCPHPHVPPPHPITTRIPPPTHTGTPSYPPIHHTTHRPPLRTTPPPPNHLHPTPHEPTSTTTSPLVPPHTYTQSPHIRTTTYLIPHQHTHTHTTPPPPPRTSHLTPSYPPPARTPLDCAPTRRSRQFSPLHPCTPPPHKNSKDKIM